VTDWKEYLLEEVCEEIVDCVNRTAPKVDRETPYKMIRTSNVKEGRIDLSQVFFVSEDTYKKWTRRSVPQVDDVILTREAPLGEVGIIRTNDKVFLGQRLMQYRANSSLLDPKFLYYSLRGPYLQSQINAHEGSGSTVSHIRVPDAKKFKIKLPPLKIQNAISSILGDIDEKIELNMQMNETLEQMAIALYKEWFNNDEGEKCKFSELVSLNPRMSVKKGTNIHFIDMKALPTDSCSIQYEDIQTKPFSSGTKFMNGDILFSRITPCLQNGKTAIVDVLCEGEIGAGSTEFLIFRPTDLTCTPYIYCLSRDKAFRKHAEQSMVGTSGRQRVQKQSILDYEVPLPDKEVMKEFSLITKKWFELINKNTIANYYLKKTRDYLLPQLLSGEIDLSKAAEKVREVISNEQSEPSL